jgi:hypothetical protein
VANEEALDRGVRAVERDLNRVLPGDPESDTREVRRAAALLDAIDGCLPLGIHSTQLFDEPFGVLADPTPTKRRLFRQMGISSVLDTTGLPPGRCVDHSFLDVEAGLEGNPAGGRERVRLYRRVPPGVGSTAADEPVEDTETTLYAVDGILEKDLRSEYQFLTENFEWVESGEVYAERDGEPLVADEAFVPAFASSTGYEAILGYQTHPEGLL